MIAGYCCVQLTMVTCAPSSFSDRAKRRVVLRYAAFEFGAGAEADDHGSDYQRIR